MAGERIRFHLDEHVDPAIAAALRRHGVDVTTTNDVGLREADDREHLEFVMTEGRVMVTRDTDFLRIASQERAHPGIAFYTADHSVGGIVRALILIYEVLTPAEMAGRVEYL